MFKLVKVEESRNIEEQKIIREQRIKDFFNIYEKHKENFIVRDCPICGSKQYSQYNEFYNTYKVCKCNACASLFVNPCPNIEAIGDYYSNSQSNIMVADVYRKRHKLKNNFMLDDRTNFVLDYINKIDKDEIKVLEVGCGVGSFLSKLNSAIKKQNINKKVKLFGIDIDDNSINDNVDEALELYCSSAEDFIDICEEKFDIILHFELLEHLMDPYEFMKNLKELLVDNGCVLFTTPNYNGLEQLAVDYNSYRILPHSIFPPIHINAFSTLNITHFAIRSGFSVVEIDTPGRLDVDIVSIHREQLTDEGLKLLCDFDDEIKGVIQYLVTLLKSSSHMRCVLKKVEI